eukprot:COSAG02_NODE_47575_length_341_cov_0.738589_1_plen_30_part_01
MRANVRSCISLADSDPPSLDEAGRAVSGPA